MNINLCSKSYIYADVTLFRYNSEAVGAAITTLLPLEPCATFDTTKSVKRRDVVEIRKSH